jgi:ankyrin repeat protein
MKRCTEIILENKYNQLINNGCCPVSIVAAVVMVGCGESQQSAPASEAKTEPTTAKAPDISIHDAAYDGNIEAVQHHIAAGTDVNAKNKYGLAPLHYAANKEIAELLIAEGTDVNAKDDNGSTPLHGEAVGGSKEVGELLIAKGADVNAKQKAGGTPLDLAIQFKEPELAALIRKHGGKTGKELKADGK